MGEEIWAIMVGVQDETDEAWLRLFEGELERGCRARLDSLSLSF